MFNSTTLVLLSAITTETTTRNITSVNATVPLISDPRVYLTWKVKVAIMYWAPFLLCGVGTLGNGVSMVVMSRKSFHVRASFYPRLLAILDTCVLWTFVLARIGGIYRGGLRTLWGCKWYLFFASFFTMTAIWTVVLLTADRFIVIVFPLRAARWSTMKSAWIGASSMFLVLTGLNLHWLWTGTVVRYSCQYDYANRGKDFIKYWAYFDSSVTFYIPIILVSVFNTIIRLRLNSAMRVTATMAGIREKQVENHRQMTIMLLTVSVTFVVLLLPYAVYSITETYWMDVHNPRSYALGGLLQAVALVFQLIQHSTNFFLYFASGQTFRKELLNMLFCKNKDTTAGLRQRENIPCDKLNTSNERSSGAGNEGMRQNRHEGFSSLTSQDVSCTSITAVEKSKD